MKLFKKELFWLLIIVVVFIVLRSFNFIYYLTFIGWDQPEQAMLALEVFRKKKLVLIGPPISAVSYQGRVMFIGPLMTYLMVFFSWLGKLGTVNGQLYFYGFFWINDYSSLLWS